jgi:hypothetical protein
VLNNAACEQFNDVGRLGKVKTAGGAGLTVIVLEAVIGLPHVSV